MIAKIAGSNAVPTARRSCRSSAAQLLAWSDALVARARRVRAQQEARHAVRAAQSDASRSKGMVDWGMAEALAFASLLASGTPIRLTGQDTERGTFSHRHAVLARSARAGSDVSTIPLQHLAAATSLASRFTTSPLSEYACVGFEYGYSTQRPTRWCCGKRSTATSSTARRSSSISSSPPVRRSGGRRRA